MFQIQVRHYSSQLNVNPVNQMSASTLWDQLQQAEMLRLPIRLRILRKNNSICFSREAKIYTLISFVSLLQKLTLKKVRRVLDLMLMSIISSSIAGSRFHQQFISQTKFRACPITTSSFQLYRSQSSSSSAPISSPARQSH